MTLSVLDEFTRECVAIFVAFSIRAEDVLAMLRKVFRSRGVPGFLRSDNGSEFTAEAVRAWLEDSRVGPAFIPPGQPWKNGFIESFHDKFRDECLEREWLQSLEEAQVVIERWRKRYNTQRPHRALGYQTPAQFAAAYKTKRALPGLTGKRSAWTAKSAPLPPDLAIRREQDDNNPVKAGRPTKRAESLTSRGHKN